MANEREFFLKVVFDMEIEWEEKNSKFSSMTEFGKTSRVRSVTPLKRAVLRLSRIGLPFIRVLGDTGIVGYSEHDRPKCYSDNQSFKIAYPKKKKSIKNWK